MIGSSKQRGGLYNMSSLQRTPIAHQVSHPSNLRHMCLGHPSPFWLKLVSPLLSSNDISYDNNCSVCPMAKRTRLPFSSSSISTYASFDLLHCDIWGPHKVPTHLGARFFLTIVDDFTRCTWISIMQYKFETQQILNLLLMLPVLNFMSALKLSRWIDSSLRKSWMIRLCNCLRFDQKINWPISSLNL